VEKCIVHKHFRISDVVNNTYKRIPLFTQARAHENWLRGIQRFKLSLSSLGMHTAVRTKFEVSNVQILHNPTQQLPTLTFFANCSISPTSVRFSVFNNTWISEVTSVFAVCSKIRLSTLI